VRTLTALAEDLLASQPGVPGVGAAVAVPGLVQHDDGTVVFAPNLGWADVPLGEMLTAALGRTLPGAPPVEVGNDADFGVAAEHMRGAGEGWRAGADSAARSDTWSSTPSVDGAAAEPSGAGRPRSVGPPC
jgi:predicted NBD/HSP70 family sugar kinase